MKTKFRSRYAVALTVALVAIMGMILAAPPRLEGAEARATVSAEVVDPAAIDASMILADAAADAAGRLDHPADQRQVAPQVQVLVVEGVTFLYVDYN